ncbi:MAG: hypothetical protein A4E49_01960 [Methanosaeta sp. PtaU1.Bin112]|nr:MAG: hypothetical protein A4E49_01960 [Methanosaeta sp. PtaU1.Bin112]
MFFLRLFPIAVGWMLLALSGTTLSSEFEIFAPIYSSDNYIDIQQKSSFVNEPPYIVITPASGAAPLDAILQVGGLERIDFLFWGLDRDGDGQIDLTGQASPYQEITYTAPGNYFPAFNFYNERNEMIAQARGSITVTDNQLPSAKGSAAVGDYNIERFGEGAPLGMQYISPGLAQAPFLILGGFPVAESNGTDDTASQSQALTAAPSGWGIVKDARGSGDRRPAQNLNNGQNSWSPPKEEFTDYLKPQLSASTERGEAPLTVSFDASGTYSRYGVMRYNFDVIWGPHEAEDDGYYLYSGNSPQWMHTFEEYGMYLAILDVEDNSGNRGRTTKVIFVL